MIVYRHLSHISITIMRHGREHSNEHIHTLRFRLNENLKTFPDSLQYFVLISRILILVLTGLNIHRKFNEQSQQNSSKFF